MNKNQLQPLAQPSLVDDELVVVVAVKASVARPVAADKPHTRGRVLSVFNEGFVGRAKLRVNKGAVTLKDQFGFAPIGFSDGEVVFAPPFHRRHQPLPAFAQIHLPQRCAVPSGDGAFSQRFQIHRPDFAVSREEQLTPVGTEMTRIAVNALWVVRQLDNFAFWEASLVKLSSAAAVGCENQPTHIRRRGTSQRIEVVVDALVRRQLDDQGARSFIPPRHSLARQHFPFAKRHCLHPPLPRSPCDGRGGSFKRLVEAEQNRRRSGSPVRPPRPHKKLNFAFQQRNAPFAADGLSHLLTDHFATS